MKNSKTIETIKHLLETYPDSKDDDNDLLARVWYYQLEEEGSLGSAEITRFCKIIKRGILKSPETVRRTRQKLQEVHEDLRGHKYADRQKHEKKVRQEIRKW